MMAKLFLMVSNKCFMHPCHERQLTSWLSTTAGNGWRTISIKNCRKKIAVNRNCKNPSKTAGKNAKKIQQIERHVIKAVT